MKKRKGELFYDVDGVSDIVPLPHQIAKGDLFGKAGIAQAATPQPAPKPSLGSTIGQVATAGGTTTINNQIGNPFGKTQSSGRAVAGGLFKKDTFTHEEVDLHFDASGGRDQHFIPGKSGPFGMGAALPGHTNKGLPHGEYKKQMIPLSLVPRAHSEAPVEEMAHEYADKKTKAPAIIVRPHPQHPGMYQVMDGQHRARAAHLRGDTHIEALVHQPKEK